MTDLYSLPENVVDLVEHLDNKFPNRCIHRNETFEDAQRLAGARDVINYLIDLRDHPEVPF